MQIQNQIHTAEYSEHQIKLLFDHKYRTWNFKITHQGKTVHAQSGFRTDVMAWQEAKQWVDQNHVYRTTTN